MGVALLLVLFGVAVLAGASVAARVYPTAGAERALATLVVASGAILVPVHVLGWVGFLTRTTIALSVLVMFVLLVAVSAGRDAKTHVPGWLAAAGEPFVLPFRALVLAWRERSVSAIAMFLAMGAWVYSGVAAYLAPSNSWDGLLYHEPMVGFAIQNRGFDWVELPSIIDLVNGYPRGAENLQLVFAIFGGRAVIDLALHWTAPIGLLAVYCLVRRFTGRDASDGRPFAIGLAAAFFLVPGYLLQLRSTYIDVSCVALLLAGTCFVTRPVLRVGDLWLAALALGLFLGMKANSPIVAFPIFVAALVRGIRIARGRVRAVVVTFVLGLALCAGLGAPTFARAWMRKGNPIWPVKLEVPALGIHFDGLWVEEQPDASWYYDHTLGPPRPGTEFPDIRDAGYGHVFPWIMLPLAVLALALLLGKALASFVQRFRLSSHSSMSEVDWNALLVMTLLILATAASPAFWLARFNLHGMAAGFVGVAWLFGTARGRFLAEGIVGACAAFAFMYFFWARPGWDVTPKEMMQLLELDPAARAAQPIGVMLPPPELQRAQELELGAGDVAAFDVGFLGLHWNEEMSNRLVWVPFTPSATYLERLDAAGAKWVFTGPGTGPARALERTPGWGKVGDFNRQTVAFRRTSPM